MSTKFNMQYSAMIMIIVRTMDTTKCLCVCYTFVLFFDRTPSFVTIGDATESFLISEDSNTIQMCLGSQNDFASNSWGRLLLLFKCLSLFNLESDRQHCFSLQQCYCPAHLWS